MRAHHRYPHFMVGFDPPLSSDEREQFEVIPGIRKRQDRLLVPYHAGQQVQQTLRTLSRQVSAAQWVIPPSLPVTWEQYTSYLETQDELRPFVLEGFLMPYQIAAIAATGHRVGTHFWHPTGSGKTLTGIIWCLLRPGPIVIVTRAASRLQFGREVSKYTKLKAFVVRPMVKKKQITLNDYLTECEEKKQRPVVIMAWEALCNNGQFSPALATMMGLRPGSVIFDESHRGKSTKRNQVVPLAEPPEGENVAAWYRRQEGEARRLGGFIPRRDGSWNGPDMGRVMIVPCKNVTTAASTLSRSSQRVVCTTATPVKDRIRDLWAQLDLAEPLAWGSANVWLHRYCAARPGLYGGLDTRGQSNLEELAARLDDVVHRVDYEETHRHLPDKRRQSVYIAPEDQCRPSAGFPKELKAASKRGAGAVLEVRLAQAASRKTKAVLGIVEDHVSSGHKVVLFSSRRRDVDRLKAEIKKCPLVKRRNVDVWSAHGEKNAGERQEIVDTYAAHPGPCVLVATGHSVGESMDGLQCTDAALFVMLPYTPGDIKQWEGRFCRNGQDRPVIIYYTIAEDTVDEHVAEILITKMDAVEKIAQDDELAEAAAAIGGIDDEDELLDSILAKMEEE